MQGEQSRDFRAVLVSSGGSLAESVTQQVLWPGTRLVLPGKEQPDNKINYLEGVSYDGNKWLTRRCLPRTGTRTRRRLHAKGSRKIHLPFGKKKATAPSGCVW